MRTMVCFRAGDNAYCIPVEQTRSVRNAAGMISLPDPRPGVAGMISGDPPLTVLCSLGRGGAHILVVQTENETFGLLVDEVTSLYKVDDETLRPAPPGQASQLVSGTMDRHGELLLVADSAALAAML